jgi:hypothetical protein
MSGAKKGNAAPDEATGARFQRMEDALIKIVTQLADTGVELSPAAAAFLPAGRRP